MAKAKKYETPAGPRWRVRHRGPDGRELSRTFDKKGAAEVYAASIVTAKATGQYVDPRAGAERFTVTAEAWHRGRVGLAPTTVAQHRSYLDSLILPTFGGLPLDAITPETVRRWVADLDTAGKSAATIAKALTLLRAVLNQAVEDRKLPRSPAAVRIELPKAPHREMLVLTPDQVADLVDAVGPFYRVHVLTAAQTGLRWGELAGLPVSAVDTLNGELRVRQQLTEVNGSHEVTERLKTPSSRRTVTIPRLLADTIGEHLGRFPNGLGLAFTTTEGAYLRRSNFARSVFKPAAAAIGVPALRVHDLRHTHASLLLAMGEPIPQVSQRLGHRNVATTMRLYAHAIPGTERSAADRMGEMFGSIPSTVRGSRGMDAGYGDTAEVLDFPQTQ